MSNLNVFSTPEQRVAVFIDTQNIYHSAKNIYHRRVNFKTILKLVLGERKLVKAFAYVVRSEVNEGEFKFFEALKKFGIQLRVKDLQVYGGFKKGDWDVGIAVDAVKIAPSVDVIILVTGDGDFLSLVEYLQHQGKQVEIAAFSQTTSSKLKESADFFFDLSAEVPKILLRVAK